MVLAKITYQCGCGYRTVLLQEAMEHARKSGHSMTVSGTICAEKPKSR